MEKRLCPKCGAEVSRTARCCLACGEFLEKLSPAQQPTEQKTAPTTQAAQSEVPMAQSDAPLAQSEVPMAQSEVPVASIFDIVEKTERTKKQRKQKKKAAAFDESKRLGCGKLMLLQLLFAIPIVGFICSICLACSKKRSYTTHVFAKSRVIWGIIFIVLLVASYVLYELWLREWLISRGMFGFSIFGNELMFQDLTLFG